MTVCIAAIYQNEGNGDGIVLVADWQKTDSNTNRKSDTAFKLNRLTSRVAALGSGDLELFNDISSRTSHELDQREDCDSLTVEEVKDCYLSAERAYRMAFLKRHVLYRFEAIQETLAQTVEPDERKAFLRYAEEQSRDIEVPYSNDVIIAGLDNDGRASIYKITPQACDNHTKQAYAIIGEGDSVAEAEFQKRLSVPFFGKGRTLFLCYMAKRRSEVIASVGALTGIYTMEEDGNDISFSNSVMGNKLKEEFEKLENLNQKNETETYHQIQNVFEEARPDTGEIENDDTPTNETGVRGDIAES